ncbi:unnamed protein product [Rhizoctonia solani]|uniref:Uncharacterized protein n=1 Tax=Rhizoctonia solani TaxID=456999 RepID=A0A8H3H095_9AGAM|nr:unnamed protein product [Rhizoctonia solani]
MQARRVKLFTLTGCHCQLVPASSEAGITSTYSRGPHYYFEDRDIMLLVKDVLFKAWSTHRSSKSNPETLKAFLLPLSTMMMLE